MRRILTRTCAVALLFAAAACGIPQDAAPRDIPEDELPAALVTGPTSTTAPPESSVIRALYFVQENPGGTPVFAKVDRRVPLPADIPQVLETLFDGADSPKVSSRIPENVRLLGHELDVDSGVLTLDLSSEMGTVTGTGQAVAFGQIVWTVTEFPDVRAVKFQIEGRPTDAPTPTASRSIVRRSDYDQYAPKD